MLGQIIINDQGILTTIAEVFAHGTTGIRCQELHRSRVRSGRGHHDGVFQRTVLFQLAHYVGDGGCLLAHSHVDTGHVLTLLVDDRIDRNRCLTGLTIANDQLTLTTTHGNHGVDGLQTSLHRLINRLTVNHAWGNFFNLVSQLGIDRAFAIDRLTQSIHHATTQFGTNRHFQNATGAFHGVAFGDVLIFTQNHGAHGITFQVQRQTVCVVGEFQHFTLHHIGQTINTHNTICHAKNRAFSTCLSRRIVILDTTTNQTTNFRRVELHLSFLISIFR